jgi:hypothetical protein
MPAPESEREDRDRDEQRRGGVIVQTATRVASYSKIQS